MAVVVSGCVVPIGDPRVDILSADRPVAVGAKVDGVVAGCQTRLNLLADLVKVFELGLIASMGRIDALVGVPFVFAPQCEPVQITIDDLSIESGDAFLLETTQSPKLTLLAVKEGATTVRASLHVDGKPLELHHTFTAKQANHVEMVAETCQGRSPILVKGSQLAFSYELRAGDEALTGYDYDPIDATNMTLQGGALTLSPVYVTSSTASSASLRSSVDPSFAFDVTLVDPGAFDRMLLSEVQPRGERFAGETLQLISSVSMNGQEPCLDPLVRRVSSETPQTCLPSAKSVLGGWISVELEAPGVCRINVTLKDSPLSASYELTVEQGWREVPVTSSLFAPRAVWGTGPSDVWVAGGTTYTFDSQPRLAHFDGTLWAVTELDGTGTLSALWGAASNDVWTVGTNGLVAHFDGAAWTTAMNDTTVWEAITGSAADDVWVVGDAGKTMHWDGAAWTAVSSPATEALTGVWEAARTDVYAITGKMMIHWDGTAWSTVPLTNPPDLRGIWGSGPGDIWVVGCAGRVHFDGTAWTSDLKAFAAADECADALWGSGPSDVISVGAQTTHFDGTAWGVYPAGPGEAKWSIWGSSAKDVWAVGSGVVARFIR
jgi:hypothetical protein